VVHVHFAVQVEYIDSLRWRKKLIWRKFVPSVWHKCKEYGHESSAVLRAPKLKPCGCSLHDRVLEAAKVIKKRSSGKKLIVVSELCGLQFLLSDVVGNREAEARRDAMLQSILDADARERCMHAVAS